ncbi:MAG: Molybdenum-containing formylmethanofuran dehydrogenase 1 subunit C [Methanosaeta sp. PtaU1.Bin060]|nr:MAG: Molybdenum-containing formylmethanofuran dehydrogenase 1 subunit C [Methanosaeta sp. PtaU1.Bin060]
MEATLPLSVHTGGLEKIMAEFLLNTGSTIDEGRLAKGGRKLTDEYTEECAVCKMNPQDHCDLGSPGKVKVISRDKKHSVAVYARPDRSVPQGQVFMPRAVWSNVVVDPETFSTGSPLYKGSPVVVEPTGDDVLSAEALVLKLYRRV